jgi:predicted nucleotidyltransferase
MHAGRTQVLQAELDRFVDIVSRDMNPERIVLFGSFAHGEVHEWSDLDIVVSTRLYTTHSSILSLI